MMYGTDNDKDDTIIVTINITTITIIINRARWIVSSNDIIQWDDFIGSLSVLVLQHIDEIQFVTRCKGAEINHDVISFGNSDGRELAVFKLFDKGKVKNEILNNFRQRISNDVEGEFLEAKKQVKKIATFRLNEIINKWKNL